MRNLNLITQDGWRVRIVHYIAKAIGLLVHVEGIPFGSNRHYPNKFVGAERCGAISTSRPAGSPPGRSA